MLITRRRGAIVSTIGRSQLSAWELKDAVVQTRGYGDDLSTIGGSLIQRSAGELKDAVVLTSRLR